MFGLSSWMTSRSMYSSNPEISLFYVWINETEEISLCRMHTSEKTLPGDVLLVAAFISYVGCFTKHYRIELMDKMWLPLMQKINVSEGIHANWSFFSDRRKSWLFHRTFIPDFQFLAIAWTWPLTNEINSFLLILTAGGSIDFSNIYTHNNTTYSCSIYQFTFLRIYHYLY